MADFDMSQQTQRFIEALAANLHQTFFHSPLLSVDEQKDVAKKLIKTAEAQVGKPMVDASLKVLHTQLRDKVAEVYTA